MTVSEKALVIRVAYTGDLMFDDAIMELLGKLLEEIKKNPELNKVTDVKHYSDHRVPIYYIELILDKE